MDFFKSLILHESNKTSQKEIAHTIAVVNKIYNEWKKTGRRINAVDLITTSGNKIATINPDVLPLIHEATRLKLATIIMRCLDLPAWKDVSTKEKLYKKLYPLIEKLQTYDPNTGTGGNLREIIMTRLSASICRKGGNRIFVAYEPTISNAYLKYMFKDEELPTKTYKMQALKLPADFESLLSTLEINQAKVDKQNQNKS